MLESYTKWTAVCVKVSFFLEALRFFLFFIAVPFLKAIFLIGVETLDLYFGEKGMFSYFRVCNFCEAHMLGLFEISC